MKLAFNQIPAQLKQTAAPIYWVSGDEPWGVREAQDLIRAGLRNAGFSEREWLVVEPGFDWAQVAQAASSLSLFGDRKIVELKLASTKVSSDGQKALVALAAQVEQFAGDTVFLIVGPKLDSGAKKTKWFKTVEASTQHCEIWPKEGAELQKWISERARHYGFQADREAVRLLFDHGEGNMLAIDQELEKLVLLQESGDIDLPLLSRSIGETSKYDVFSLIDAMLQGNKERSTKLCYGLQAEGVKTPAVVAMLANQIEQLCRFRIGLDKGSDSLAQMMKKERVFYKKEPFINAAMQRLSLAKLRRLNEMLVEIELQSKGGKGSDSIDPWVSVLRFSQLFCS